MNALPMAASGVESRAWNAWSWSSVVRRARTLPALGSLLGSVDGPDEVTSELELDEETVHLHHCRGPWSRDIEPFLVKIAA